MDAWFYIPIGVFIIAALYLYWLCCRWMAGRLIMLFVAQAFFVRKMTRAQMPTFILEQALNHSWEVKWPFRWVAMWYIRNRGYYYATRFVEEIIEDARRSDQLELAE